MKFLTKNLANIFTLTNLFLGFTGIINALYGDPVMGAWLLLCATLFDFLDGMTARLLKTQSKIGKELDSFADLVSFGVLPAVILHVLLVKTHYSWVYAIDFTGIPLVSLLPFVFTAAVAIRLARFNLDKKQSKVFSGLPSPAAALFVASIPLIMQYDLYMINYQSIYLDNVLLNPWLLLGTTFLLSWLMLARIPLLSLKMENWGWKDNKSRYILIGLSIPLFVILLFLAIPVILLIYFLLSFISKPESL